MCRALGLFLCVAAAAPAVFGAAISLKTDDALNTSSLTGSTNWSNGLAPTNGNDYLNVGRTLRTPATANGVHVFGGTSLTITGVGNQSVATSEALMFKGTGVFGLITISNLAFDGGQLRNASGSADSFNLAGNSLAVGSLGMAVHMQGPIVVSAPVTGSGNIKILDNGNTDAARTLRFTSASNTFVGNITLVTANQSRFALDAGANLNFVIGAAGVNNTISGSGVATFNGRFVFDLSGASTNLGDSWIIAGVSGRTFGGTFSVDGFTNITGTAKWEVATNGIFYSFDTTSCVLQVVSGFSASPNQVLNSRVALLRDTIVATNACLMAGTAPYGRAMNGISFQDQILLTFDGYQYTAWYDIVGTMQLIWLARRPVTNASGGAWEKFQTDSEFTNGDEGSWDAHNVIAFGICPGDGTLHLAWDLHGQTLKYRRSVLGLCTTNKSAWGAGMLGPQTNKLSAADAINYDASVTYPQFVATPDNKLILNRRYQDSGNGDCLMQTYDPATGTWSANRLFISRVGTYSGSASRNAYLNGFDLSPDGKIHVTWTWREGAGSANHDLCYAYSADGGVTWRDNAGNVVADTGLGQSMNLNTPGIIFQPLNTQQLLINQQAQCVDNDGRLHVLVLHRRTDPGYEYPNYTTANFSTLATAYFHYFRDPATGVWTQRRLPPDLYPVGSRPKIAFDAQGNVYGAYLSYPAGTAVVPGYRNGKLVLASATKASGYSDWAVAQALTNDFNGEPLVDQARLLSDNVLSVYIQENSANSAVVGTPLHVLDFAVGVTMPNPISLNFMGADAVISISSLVGHTYQLQSAATLSPANWVNVGALMSGVNAPLALSDPNGRLGGRRFYRVIQDP